MLFSKNMGDWNAVGDSNWRMEDGAAVTDKGNGNLVSKRSYKDFQVRAEIWVTPESITGIYIRIQTPERPSSKAGYEVNINDLSKNIGYGTGAIVGVARSSTANIWPAIAGMCSTSPRADRTSSSSSTA